MSQQVVDGVHKNEPSENLQRGTPANHNPRKFQVWTSMMQRSIQTAQNISAPEYQTKHLRMLDELNAGVLEGLTCDEVKDFYADWYSHRQMDKFHSRYPGTAGEGYFDVTNRLKAVILRVESETDHVLLISGLAVTRILLAYFKRLHSEDIVDLHVPLGTLHVLEPKPYGVEDRIYVYNSATEWFDLKE
ncbi:hypothetical protein ONS95_008791 [Cadophora gregata]|uniref:uncharacterized protein n=1 Tax=Cadophora gregata TaxID=51156 RepID=UPI0026DC2D71|nr:uncharacterized protein ONS95_008791 [Cadophora gregata]KAK0123790.1 hypothetical protein ONS95_008791 [Cadophora gregata]KAK0130134.1 hypothetical protein ONS96_000661 [Cadophora gregata f. sp. sojae]